jgi:hypothetical protein
MNDASREEDEIQRRSEVMANSLRPLGKDRSPDLRTEPVGEDGVRVWLDQSSSESAEDGDGTGGQVGERGDGGVDGVGGVDDLRS